VKLFEHICLGSIAAGAAFMMVQGGLFFRAARLQIAPLAASARATINSANNLLDRTSFLEDTVFDAAEAVSSQAVQQAADWRKTQLQVYKTITDTKQIMVQTDKSLNYILVPKLAAALDSTTHLSDTAATQLTDTMNELQPTFDSFAKASAATAETMADPRIGEAIGHLDETSAHAAELSEHTEKTAAHLEGAAADVQTFIHRETTPVRGVWNTIKAFLRTFGPTAASAATAARVP
jgi:hypothetical protein